MTPPDDPTRSPLRGAAYRAVAALTAAVCALGAAPGTAQAAPDSSECLTAPIAAEAGPLEAALEGLSSAETKAVAAKAAMSVSELREHAIEDESLFVDACGQTYAVDPAPARAEVKAAEAAPIAEPSFASSQTFKLNSRPGADRTIYLNFTGETVSGRAWNSQAALGRSTTNTAPIVIAPYSIDSDTTSLSGVEHASIQALWSGVAEDFAPFDVNVTTEKPARDALFRSSSSDEEFGLTVLIGAGGDAQRACYCGGVAWINTFTIDGPWYETYEYAFAFTDGAGSSGEFLTGTISHEAGHTLSLNHDGVGNQAYYSGSAPWSPIMGSGYGPVSQWSRGEYPNASNFEDDLFAISERIPYVSDDHANYADPSATQLPDLSEGAATASGLIATAADVDVFSFRTGGGQTNIDAGSLLMAGGYSNLDIRMDIFNSEGAIVATVRPAAVYSRFDGLAGIDASWSGPLDAGTYYVAISGDSHGTGTTAGTWSKYGSLGRYSLSVSTPGTAVEDVRATGTDIVTVVDEAVEVQLEASGGDGTITWDAVDELPRGLLLTSDGQLTGAVSDPVNGSYTVRASSAGKSAEVAVSVVAHAGSILAVQTTTRLNVTSGVKATHEIALDRNSGKAFTFALTSPPAWASISSAGVVTLTAPQAGSFTLSGVLSVGTRTQPFTIVVEASSQADPLSANAPETITTRKGNDFAKTLTSTGGAIAAEWRKTSGPAWVSVTTDGVVSGRAPQAGTFTYQAIVTSGVESVNVQGKVVVYETRLLDLKDLTLDTVAGAESSAALSVTAKAGETYSFTLDNPPSWASITADGVVKVKPPVPGRFELTATVSGRVGSPTGPVFTEKATVIVVAQPQLKVEALNLRANANTDFTARVVLTGGEGEVSFSLSGAPDGVSISSTGALSGRLTQPGSYHFTVTARSGRQVATAAVALVITAPVPPTPTVETAPALTLKRTAGAAARANLGTTSQLTWKVTSGSLPAGMKLGVRGLATGTPKKAGTWQAVVLGSSSTMRVTRTVRFTIAPKVKVAGTNAKVVVKANQRVNIKLTASAGNPKYTFTSSGKLPAALKVSVAANGKTVKVTGKVKKKGTYKVRLTAADKFGSTASRLFTIQVK